ncbi:MAG TPA: Tim44/TimA family putative adaptor protein [Thermohalobaculum sp.]|nr:Tim44/TimA family putative adaptor protein [Thermohalobaculum sp.]
MSTQMIELLILFAIAAFVLFRLKSVIGTRTGYEAPPDYLRRERGADGPGPGPVGNVEPAEEATGLSRPVPEHALGPLARMREAEPDFSLATFVEGARGAYEMILMAYEAGDRATLADLLAPDVLEAFEASIAEREAKGLKVDARFIGVRDIRLEAASFHSETREAEITVRFVGEMITAVRDPEGRIVEGDPNDVRRQTDIWTFARRMGVDDPNWLLAATGE